MLIPLASQPVILESVLPSTLRFPLTSNPLVRTTLPVNLVVGIVIPMVGPSTGPNSIGNPVPPETKLRLSGPKYKSFTVLVRLPML